MQWLKDNIISTLAIIISVSMLVINNVENSSAATSNFQVRITHMEEQINTLPSLVERTSQLETATALSNQTIFSLKDAVVELSSNTKELTKAMTVLAVLDVRVRRIEDKPKQESICHLQAIHQITHQIG